MDMKGRVVIVTGASSGIGSATARLLTKKGAKVALVARSGDKLRAISKSLAESFVFQADMTKTDQIKDMVKSVKDHYGRIDILVNNAGRGYDAPILRIKLETLQEIFELDFVGVLVAMQEVIPIMKLQGGGSIINISSGTALMHLPDMGAYAAIKAALAHLSLTARSELEADHINVNVVYPYITDTDFEKNTIKDLQKEDWGDERQYKPPAADSADYIAKLVLKAIESNQSEIYAHDWMRSNSKATHSQD